MPKISIIVPIYNVKEYLPKCLDSILAQTFSDVEIICVDDGSNDGSEQIIDEYAARDSRIVALHRANAGYGAAMNSGIDVAKSEYIGIVESDDVIVPEMYERLYEQATKHDLDFVKSRAYYWFESLDYKREIPSFVDDKLYGKVLTDVDRNLFFDFFMNVWTGIYKKSFLNDYNIRFNETPGASYQDNGFWLQTMMYAKRVMWLNEIFYYYRQDNPGASVRSIAKIYAMPHEYELLEQTLIERGDTWFLPYCYYYKLLRDRGTFLRIADDCKKDFLPHLKVEYGKYKAAIRQNTYLDNWFKEMVTDGDSICDNIIAKKLGVKEKLSEAKSIIIYGAGKRGSYALRNLVNENQIEKLRCFAVTSDIKEPVLANRPVMLIEDAVKQYPDSLVIIAAFRGTNAFNAMYAKAKELGAKDILDGTLFEEYFYLV